MRKTQSPKEKAEIQEWMDMSQEDKEKYVKDMGQKKYDVKMDKAANSYAIEEFLELEFVSAIEEQLECSGFCQTALFYWDQDIYQGYPDQTCGYAMLKFFRKEAGPLKVETTVIAFTCLWLFILHFTLYGKKVFEPFSGTGR